MGPLGAALAGAVVGAAAVFLADEKNRKKLKNTFESVKKEGSDKIKSLQQKTDDLEEKGRKKLSKELEQAKKKVEVKR